MTVHALVQLAAGAESQQDTPHLHSLVQWRVADTGYLHCHQASRGHHEREVLLQQPLPHLLVAAHPEPAQQCSAVRGVLCSAAPVVPPQVQGDGLASGPVLRLRGQPRLVRLILSSKVKFSNTLLMLRILSSSALWFSDVYLYASE